MRILLGGSNWYHTHKNGNNSGILVNLMTWQDFTFSPGFRAANVTTIT
jgi:hypothetical protein